MLSRTMLSLTKPGVTAVVFNTQMTIWLPVGAGRGNYSFLKISLLAPLMSLVHKWWVWENTNKEAGLGAHRFLYE